MSKTVVRTTPLVTDITDCAAIKAALDEKLEAYNLAASGGAIRSIQDSDTSRVEYQGASLDRLMKDIQLLQAQYAACLAGGAPAMTRPINFVF